MPLTRRQQTGLNRRVNEIFREVGTLLLAFAPLDYLQSERVDVATLTGFVLLGSLFVVLALAREIRGLR